MGFCDSGGSSSVQEFKPPSYTTNGSAGTSWQDYLKQAGTTANAGLDPYAGQTVASMSPMTQQGLQMQSAFTMDGSPERKAAGQAIVNASQGQMNPYAATANKYAGQNPYLSQMIDSSNQKITDQYRRGTEANTNAMYGRAGAFGGSDYRDAMSQNQQNLASALGANTNQLLGQNYQQSAALEESGLNRAAGGWQSGVGNALQAAQVGLGQQGLDQNAISSMIQSGQIPQQYQQNLLNAASQYYGQQQQAPFTLSDFLGSALQRASGGQGTQTYTGSGQSPLMGLLGGGAAAYGLLS